MRETICIICPRSCHLVQDEDGKISGYTCKRGLEYGTNEFTNPVRNISSTVRIEGGSHSVLPVKTSRPIPKQLMMQAMSELSEIKVKSPVKSGDAVLKNVCGVGVDFIAERDM